METQRPVIQSANPSTKAHPMSLFWLGFALGAFTMGAIMHIGVMLLSLD